MTLSFLGPPLVERDGAPVTVSRRKVLALLAYLAVTRRPHARDALAELLFPGLDRGHSSVNFRATLSYLHRAVGALALAIRDGFVGLRLEDGVRVDVWETRRLLDEARRIERKGDPPEVERLLAEAVARFRGEFLEGFSLPDSPGFDAWEERERDELRRSHARALERLAAACEARGAGEAAIDYARRWLALDAMDERAVRTLMRLLARNGDRPAAIRHYGRLAALLAEEMGSSPEVETTALRQQIATGRPAAEGGPTAPELRPPEPATNLALQPTPFIGRRRELAALTRALAHPETRLVTLTGPGGMGKTRLALEAASKMRGRFVHGVYVVDLASLADPAGVAGLIASTLGIQEVHGDRRPLRHQLEDRLRGKRMLLVLDNFEHLMPAAALVADVLGSCPGVTMVVTSRQALHLRAEHEMEVPPLALPATGRSGRELAGSAAVRLFRLRASAVRPGFALDAETGPVVADICRLLDGMPLAIELAATKVKSFPVAMLRDLLVHRLRVLRDGPRDLPPRQRALRSEIDWSYELLDRRERRLFEGLSVFAGGCTVEAAGAVCAASAGGDPEGHHLLLASLVDKSLLQRRETGGAPRFHLLETMREYAGERLAKSGDAAPVRERFVSHLLRLAERAEPALYGPEQGRRLAELDAEEPNFHAALTILRERGEGDRTVRLAGALGWYWFRRARFAEGQEWLERGLAAAAEAGAAVPRARAYYLLGLLKRCTGTEYQGNPETRACAAESLRLLRQADDERTRALALALLGSTEIILEHLAWKQATPEGIRDLEAGVAVARSTADPWVTAWCLKSAYSLIARPDKDLASKQAALEEAIVLARETGDPFLLCQVTKGMGEMLLMQHAETDSLPWLREALDAARRIDDRWAILDTLNRLASALLELGRLQDAKDRYGEGLRLAMRLGARGYLAWFIGGFHLIARDERRPRRAVRLEAGAAACVDGHPKPYDRGWPPAVPLDQDAAAAEWAAGQSLALEQLVAYALADED